MKLAINSFHKAKKRKMIVDIKSNFKMYLTDTKKSFGHVTKIIISIYLVAAKIYSLFKCLFIL